MYNKFCIQILAGIKYDVFQWLGYFDNIWSGLVPVTPVLKLKVAALTMFQTELSKQVVFAIAL